MVQKQVLIQSISFSYILFIITVYFIITTTIIVASEIELNKTKFWETLCNAHLIKYFHK